MKQIRRASEHEIVFAFLKAEVDSPRYREHVAQALAQLRLSRSELIDHGDLRNEQQNLQRLQVLGMYRGYPTAYLFHGFPSDVEWSLVELTAQDVGGLRYAAYPMLVEVSGPSRLVRDAAPRAMYINDSERFCEGVRSLVREIHRKTYPELIITQASDDASSAVLVEGHTRATAYIIASQTYPVRAFLGVSPAMRNWRFYDAMTL
jgi:hypothetical protein